METEVAGEGYKFQNFELGGKLEELTETMTVYKPLARRPSWRRLPSIGSQEGQDTKSSYKSRKPSTHLSPLCMQKQVEIFDSHAIDMSSERLKVPQKQRRRLSGINTVIESLILSSNAYREKVLFESSKDGPVFTSEVNGITEPATTISESVDFRGKREIKKFEKLSVSGKHSSKTDEGLNERGISKFADSSFDYKRARTRSKINILDNESGRLAVPDGFQMKERTLNQLKDGKSLKSEKENSDILQMVSEVQARKERQLRQLQTKAKTKIGYKSYYTSVKETDIKKREISKTNAPVKKNLKTGSDDLRYLRLMDSLSSTKDFPGKFQKTY